MGNALDLRVYDDSTFDLTMRDGSVLHVRKANEKTLLKSLGLKDVLKGEDNAQILQEMSAFLKMALSNNQEGIVVDDAFLEQHNIDLGVMLIIFKGYSEFLDELVSDPNLQSPPAASPTVGIPTMT